VPEIGVENVPFKVTESNSKIPVESVQALV
jgi:hypothetical protein